jgi:hypothetical protein
LALLSYLLITQMKAALKSLEKIDDTTVIGDNNTR